MKEHPQWAPGKPPPESWRAPAERSRADVVSEQDKTAGGRARRGVKTDRGRTATGSIELKLLAKGRRVYAYLRYSVGGRTVNRYIGEAPGGSREARLRHAWRLARKKGLLEPQRGRSQRK